MRACDAWPWRSRTRPRSRSCSRAASARRCRHPLHCASGCHRPQERFDSTYSSAAAESRSILCASKSRRRCRRNAPTKARWFLSIVAAHRLADRARAVFRRASIASIRSECRRPGSGTEPSRAPMKGGACRCRIRATSRPASLRARAAPTEGQAGANDVMFWICLHFPDLPLAVFARGDACGSPAVTASASHRPDVLVANVASKKRGVVPGLSIAAALALDPELVIHLRDEHAEAAALERVALWAGQWTSTVALEPPGCVLLEVSGALRYFGGLDRLVGRIRTGLGEIGFDSVIAVAPTPGAASLLARGGRGIATDSSGIES